VIARTYVLVKPVLTGVQLSPLFVERKTPPIFVPTKRLVPLTAKEVIDVSVGRC
jgi:hypothetical protein